MEAIPAVERPYKVANPKGSKQNLKNGGANCFVGSKPGHTRSKALAEITGTEALSPQQELFAKRMADGLPVMTACRLVGFKDLTYGAELLKRPKIRARIKELHAQKERAAQMTMKRVMQGFLDAIEQAKMMAEPATQIAGWREIGKMCGYYAPEVKRIDLNVSGQIVGRLESLSDAELLKVVNDNAQTLEGEARELLDGPSPNLPTS